MRTQIQYLKLVSGTQRFTQTHGINIDHLLLDGSDLRFTSTGILRYVIFNNLTRFHALST